MLYVREKLRVWILNPYYDIYEHIFITDAFLQAFNERLLTRRDIHILLRYLCGYDEPQHTETIQKGLRVMATLTNYTDEVFVNKHWPQGTMQDNAVRVAKMQNVDLWNRFNEHI